MKDNIGTTISNLIAEQFPGTYRENGPLLVAFVQEYFRWFEGRSEARNDWISEHVSLVATQSRNANVVGTYTFFTDQFTVGDKIAICKNTQTNDYETFNIKTVANNTLLTLSSSTIPDFTVKNARYATVSKKPNALFLTRHFFDIHDIDETFDEYVVYFKEKYLKNIRFRTITDTKTLVKHSLDLYRSKGTERSIDLLYKVVFAKPARVYYPSYDIFKLSSGVWYIPQYLELTIGTNNRRLIGKQIIGVLSGATAFVEEIIRSRSNDKIVEIAYMSNIKGNFTTGEKVILPDNSLDLEDSPIIVGSLNEIQVDINGAGLDFAVNEMVDVTSVNGTSGKAKVLSTSNTQGLINYTLVDGGYGYANSEQVANTAGTVAVTSAGTSVVGTSTFFQRDYSNGDTIALWSNSSVYQKRQIVDLSSNTALSVNAVVGFTNATATAAYVRNFAQTFVSDKILRLANVKISAACTNFEYVNFLDSISQPLAQISYVNANGVFAAGDMIYTYDISNVVKGTGRVLQAGKTTVTSGTLIVSVMSGDLNEPAIYTTANAVVANLNVSSGYTDITATANVIGHYANVTITCNNVTREFIPGETIVQLESGARGIITAVSDTPIANTVIIGVGDSIGVFKSGGEFDIAGSVTGDQSRAEGRVESAVIDMGVIKVNNEFLIYPGNYVYTPFLTGTVETVSQGSGANVTFSNQIDYAESVTFSDDLIAPFLGYHLNTTWPFRANPSANLATVINTVFTYTTITIGKVDVILSTSPGSLYNRIPIVRLYEPTIARFGVPDTLILSVASTIGFDVGEIVTQASTNARGKIMAIGQGSLTMQNMRFNANNDFQTSGPIVGVDSGATTTITSKEPLRASKRIGSDINTSATLVVGGGSITGLKVIDSGFGFIDNEQVSIESANKSALGFAVNRTHGTGTGFYKTRDGFLSDTKKLSDGWYYQEYSYEVRSGIIDEFKNSLKNIVHVAGTKYFDALYYDTINNTEIGVDTKTTSIQISELVLRDGADVLTLRDGTTRLALGH